MRHNKKVLLVANLELKIELVNWFGAGQSFKWIKPSLGYYHCFLGASSATPSTIKVFIRYIIEEG
jgi:hypothetical protein